MHVRFEIGAASATTVLPRIAEGTTAARAFLPARAAAHTWVRTSTTRRHAVPIVR